MGKNKKGEIIDCSDAVSDIKNVILKTHKVKQVKDFFNYDGVDFTESCLLATMPTIKVSLSKENLKYDKEEQGRDMLEVVLAKLFALGYQNGYLEMGERYKMVQESNKLLMETIEFYKKELDKNK